MSWAEMKGLTKAMESKEFSSIMNEYIDDISDPKHKAEMEQYLWECEEWNELPPNTKLIWPNEGFVIKTMAKWLMSEKDKRYFEQKTFINICSHESTEKP